MVFDLEIPSIVDETGTGRVREGDHFVTHFYFFPLFPPTTQ